MREGGLQIAASELSWSLWTELGAPGVERLHSKSAIDPEPLIVLTPRLAHGDPRLAEVSAAWRLRHLELLSKTRIDGLRRRAPPEVREALDSHAGSRVPAHARGSLPRGEPPPLERPALVRLRMRALCGVGARADVLCELLARRTWVTASGLTHLGYSKRGIARVLAELGEAHLAIRRERGNAHAYRLRDRRSLVRLVSGSGLAWPRWWELLLLVHRLVTLEDLAPKAPEIRRVGAHAARKELRKLALAVGLAEPPATLGAADAYERLTSWGLGVIRGTRTAIEVGSPSR